MGDFNAKHISWGCNVDNWRGTYLHKHIERSGYRILAPPTPTSDFDVDEIIQELGTHNITPEHVSVMRNRKQNKNMPLFLVVSRKCPANQAIFQVTSIGYYKIKVEPLDKNSMPAQCYRCQLFYHHSRFCNREPKCLKCSQSHLTRDCTKKPDAPAKCTNCGGPHPANFSGCEKNPKKP
ncbi:nucleic-acid-binding protein from transposon X-element [Trichonephila clavipes]|nr:nucleic-acid-binding protein from transposon X-element [Trichonephila clavipes]